MTSGVLAEAVTCVDVFLIKCQSVLWLQICSQRFGAVRTKLQLWVGFVFPLLFSSLSLGELEASGSCSSVRHSQCSQGPSPDLFTGGFLLNLLRKGEGILADPLPSESPLGSVGTLVFFPGSSALAGGSTST